MTPHEMDKLVEAHFQAEERGDVEGAVATYTDDVVHDAVGLPGAPFHGIPAARAVYTQLVADFRTEAEERLHTYYSDNAMTVESRLTGVVTGQFFGLPGNDRRITFRMLHVFEFRGDKISRENVWFDNAAIVQQLAPAA